MRTTSLPILALLLLGCGQTKTPAEDHAERISRERERLAPLVAARRAEIEPIVKALRMVDDKVTSAAPTADLEPLAAKLVASVASPDQSQLEQDGILIASPGWLQGPGAPAALLPLWPSVPIARLDTLLTEGWFDTSGYATNDQVQYALAEAAKVKHIVVVRTRELVAPTVEEATKTFTPGRAAGEVLVFSIPDGKRLGVLPFAVAQSGDSIRSMGLSGGDAVALEWRRQVLRHVIDLVVVGP